MSRREIAIRYKSLMNDVATKDFYKVDLTNRVNCYVCTVCKRITKTKDVDPGVTPFMFSCDYCKSMAYSTGYRDIAPEIKHTHEWYRPSLESVFKMRDGMVEHILKGGLDSRKL
jgi:hypothetical protein